MPVSDHDVGPDNRTHDGENSDSADDESTFSASLGSPAPDVLKNFYHTKRVGTYLIGRKLGEGSFAKVREGLHTLTGEKVRHVAGWIYLDICGASKLLVI